MKKTKIIDTKQFTVERLCTSTGDETEKLARDANVVYRVDCIENSDHTYKLFLEEEYANIFIYTTTKDVKDKFMIAYKQAKSHWDDMVRKSGKSEAMYISTSSYATEMLATYEDIKETVETEYDLKLPNLVEGVEINISNK